MKHPVSMGSLNKPCRIRERIHNPDTLLRKDDFATMINTWIEDHVAGLSFCDIGGIGLSSKNERISTALNAGATRATMIDARKGDFREWAVFKEKMDEQHLQGYDMIAGADLEDPRFPKVFRVTILCIAQEFSTTCRRLCAAWKTSIGLPRHT